MFPGFFVGTIFLFWLVRTLMWGPRYHYHGHRHRPWGAPYGPPESLWGDFGWSDRPSPRRDTTTQAPTREGLDEAVGRFVGALRNRLRATPGQEKAFDAAVAKLRDAIGDAQARLNRARDDIARAVRSEPFDDSAFDAATHRIDDAMQAIRSAARKALVDLHNQLDERQRQTLGNLIGSSPIDL